MPDGLVRIHNAIRFGDGNDVYVEAEKIREFEVRNDFSKSLEFSIS
jgi:hypothetical protein